MALLKVSIIQVLNGSQKSEEHQCHRAENFEASFHVLHYIWRRKLPESWKTTNFSIYCANRKYYQVMLEC
jgi:hypothetical protein